MNVTVINVLHCSGDAVLEEKRRCWVLLHYLLLAIYKIKEAPQPALVQQLVKDLKSILRVTNAIRTVKRSASNCSSPNECDNHLRTR
jgi:hypothetical protein